MYNLVMPVDTRLTYEDYCLLPNDGKRYEIIEGELFVTPSPVTAHQRIVTRLASYLLTYVEEHDLGMVFVAPFDVVFSRFDVVEPDILFISKAHLSVLTEKNIQGAPDLVVEVLSETTKEIDRTTKLKLYARFGVKEYWMVEPKTCGFEIYRRGKKGLEFAASLASHQTLTSPLFPGLTLPITKLASA